MLVKASMPAKPGSMLHFHKRIDTKYVFVQSIKEFCAFQELELVFLIDENSKK